MPDSQAILTSPGRQDFLDALLEALLGYFVLLMALFTACYHAGLVLGVTFETLATATGLLGAAATVFWIIWQRGRLRHNGLHPPDGVVMASLAALALACGVLALLAVRPNADDAIYLANPLLDFEHPGEVVSGHYPFAFVAPYAKLSILSMQANAMFCAVAAFWFGLQPQDVYYYLLPFLAGGCLPLVWYLLLRLFFQERRAALAGSFCVVLLLCLDGAMHRTPGSFALVRIWQGKAILKGLLTPWAIRALLLHLQQGGLYNAVRLLVIGTAALGWSIVSAFYVPILAGLVSASHWIVFPHSATLRRRLLAPALLVFYPVAMMLPQYVLIKNALGQLPSEKADNVSLETLMDFVFGWPSVTLTACILGFALLLALKRYRLAAWTGVWGGPVLLALAVPGAAKWVAENLTSHDTLWRVLYTLPFLLIVGLAVGALYEQLAGRLRGLVWSGLGAILLAAVLLALTPGSISPFSPTHTSFSLPPRYKLPADEVAMARAIMAAELPPGTMFAALPVSRTLPLLTSRYRQGELRSGFIMLPLTIFAGNMEQGLSRMAAHKFASGIVMDEAGAAALAQELKNPYDYLVVHDAVPAWPGMADRLAAQGYAPLLALPGEHTLFVRAP